MSSAANLAWLRKTNRRYIIGAPKSEQSRRMLTLPSMTVEALRARRVGQMEDRLLAGTGWQDYGLVFTTGVGTPLDPRNVTRYFQRALAAAGLPKQRFHDTRHAFASLLLANGKHARTVMEILGHSQIAVTMNTYSHVIPALKKDAAQEIDRILGSG